MELVLPGFFRTESGRSVPVYWEIDLEVPIGTAKLNTVKGFLRARISFYEQVLPWNLMTSIQNNPNLWAVGCVDDEVRYMCARTPGVTNGRSSRSPL